MIKRDLEDGVSAISMINLEGSPSAEIELDLPRKLQATKEATNSQRGATHPETNVPIINSFITHKISGNFGSARMTFSFVAPPTTQESEEILAKFHVQAFFYLLCNVDPDNHSDRTKSRAFTDKSMYLHPKYIHVLFRLRRSDWGNQGAIEFINKTIKWEQCCFINSAREHFKIRMRRSKQDTGEIYFWALEWNKNIRILGTIRSSEPCSIEKSLPSLKTTILNDTLRMRTEQPLVDEDDHLFK